jgi:hypothetical protein
MCRINQCIFAEYEEGNCVHIHGMCKMKFCAFTKDAELWKFSTRFALCKIRGTHGMKFLSLCRKSGMKLHETVHVRRISKNISVNLKRKLKIL